LNLVLNKSISIQNILKILTQLPTVMSLTKL